MTIYFDLTITQSNLNRMVAEGSTNEPTIKNMLLLHEKFNISFDWLMLGKGNIFSEEK